MQLKSFPAVTSFRGSKPTQNCEWLRHSVAVARYIDASLNQVLDIMESR